MKAATDEELSDENDMDAYEKSGNKPRHDVDTKRHVAVEPIDIATYKPKVIDRVWYVSETDLEWMSTGCYTWVLEEAEVHTRTCFA